MYESMTDLSDLLLSRNTSNNVVLNDCEYMPSNDIHENYFRLFDVTTGWQVTASFNNTLAPVLVTHYDCTAVANYN